MSDIHELSVFIKETTHTTGRTVRSLFWARWEWIVGLWSWTKIWRPSKDEAGRWNYEQEIKSWK